MLNNGIIHQMSRKELALFGVSDRFYCSTKYNLIFLEKQVQSTTDSLKNKYKVQQIP